MSLDRDACGFRGREGVRTGRAGHHDDWQTERAGRGELGRGRRAAAVLGDDEVYLVGDEKRLLRSLVERSAREDRGCVRRQVGGFHRLDAADQVAMHRRSTEDGDFLTSDGEKHPARIGAECRGGGGHVRGPGPVIAWTLAPSGAAQRDERHARPVTRGARVRGHAYGERVGGVGQDADVVFPEPVGEAIRAPEAARTDFACRQIRRTGPTGEGIRKAKAGALRQEAGEFAGLARAAEDEDMHDGF